MAYFNPVQAYQHASQTMSQKDQIVMLYAAAISYVQQAKEADAAGDHDTRYRLLDKTLAIVRGLHACLDVERNGELARALGHYYEDLELLISAAQCDDNKAPLCDKIIHNLRTIWEAWGKVEDRVAN